MAKTQTILIVEDDTRLLKVLALIFKKAGYNILTSENGEEAIKAAKENNPDAVLLDLMLPDISGVEVLRKIKQVDINIPVIICSGSSDINLATDSMKYGAYDYIVKPFDTEKMIKMVKDSVTKRAEIVIEEKKKKKQKKREAGKGADIKKVILPLSIVGGATVVIAMLYLLLIKPGLSLKEEGGEAGIFFKMPYSHPTALALKNDGYMWVSDWYGQSVYRHKIEDNSLPLIKAYNIPDSNFTGLTFCKGYLWSCDSTGKRVYVHALDGKLTVIKSYETPGTSPSGLFYDGRNLWTCDNDIKAIYKHKMDEELSIISKYDSPGPNPVGIFGDGQFIYTADADNGEIYKHMLDEELTVVDTYKPDIFPFKIAGVTYDGKYIWVSIEDEAKVCRYDLKDLQK